jgi:ABC-type multidrug transport system ATPase subunit
MIRFWARGNGPGFPPDARVQLFAPLSQIGTVRNPGYGLGLSFTLQIIDKLGGQVGVGSLFFFTLSEGYNTVVNEESSNISEGRMQLLTIARAILADPRILILDEATSSVDTHSEVLIQKAMDTLMQGRTSFIFAQCLSTIRDAEWIPVMNNGDIVEQGNHAKLLAKKGFYAELYNSQFEGKKIQPQKDSTFTTTSDHPAVSLDKKGLVTYS